MRIVFLVTTAVRMPRSFSHCSTSTVPGASASVRRPSSSISSTMADAAAASAAGICAIASRMSCERSTPHRLYMTPKSRFGFVSVPSMSKTTPRRSGRGSAIATKARRARAGSADEWRPSDSGSLMQLVSRCRRSLGRSQAVKDEV